MNALSIALLKKLQDYGTTYEGDTDENGLKSGHGKCKYGDGSVYDGDWINGQRHGFGKYTFSNDAIYEGNWQDDKMHGKGKLHLPSGDVIETTFRQVLIVYSVRGMYV